MTQALRSDAQWGTWSSPDGAAEGKPETRCETVRSRCSKSPEKRSNEWVREGRSGAENPTEGLSAVPTEGESEAND